MKFKWNWRVLVSYFLLFAAAILLISGIALFVAPSGRIARTTGWEFLGLTKTQWEEIHTVFGYAGAIFGLFHLLLNWRCLVGYLRRRVRWIQVRPEFLLAVILGLIAGIGAVLGWFPV